MPTTVSTPMQYTPRQRGFTLIEVLVTVIVLAIGLLGLAGLQLNSLKYNYSAYQTSQATVMANDIADRMRANRSAADNGAYDIAFGATPAETSCQGAGVSCDSASMANADLFEWKRSVTAVLPEGDVSVQRNGPLFVITVRWNDNRDTDDVKTLVMETLL